MNDAGAAPQLLSGFYPVEANAWRWTGRKFSVLLRTPPRRAQTRGALSLGLTFPDPSAQQLKNITLTASVNGMMLKSEEYTAAGPQTFTADVPAPSAAELRQNRFCARPTRVFRPELTEEIVGIVATSVSLAAK